MAKTKPTAFEKMLEGSINAIGKSFIAGVAEANATLVEDIKGLYTKYHLPRPLEELTSTQRRQLTSRLDIIVDAYAANLDRVKQEAIDSIKAGAVKAYIAGFLFNMYIANQDSGLNMKFIKAMEVEE